MSGLDSRLLGLLQIGDSFSERMSVDFYRSDPCDSSHFELR